jgi:hypothetical protein
LFREFWGTQYGHTNNHTTSFSYIVIGGSKGRGCSGGAMAMHDVAKSSRIVAQLYEFEFFLTQTELKWNKQN